MKRALTTDFVSALLILLFFYTALSKVADHKRFEDVLSSSPILHPAAGFISWFLPIVEIFIVILLFVPSTRIKGFYGSILLLFILTGYIIYMILFTPHLPCNCGGVLKYLSWRQHILFNFFFIVIAAFGIMQTKKGEASTDEGPT